MSWRQAAAQEDGPVQVKPKNDKNKKANEIVRAIVGSMVTEGEIVVASDSKSKAVERHEFAKQHKIGPGKMSTLRGNPGSALRVFTSSERLANQLKINEIGKLVTKIEMDTPKFGKLLKKNDMSNSKVGKIGEEDG